jgi:hypothetical protein
MWASLAVAIVLMQFNIVLSSLLTYNIPSTFPITELHSQSISLNRIIELPTDISSLVCYIHQSQLVDDSATLPILYKYIETLVTTNRYGKLTILLSAQDEQIAKNLRKFVTDTVHKIVAQCGGGRSLDSIVDVS